MKLTHAGIATVAVPVLTFAALPPTPVQSETVATDERNASYSVSVAGMVGMTGDEAGIDWSDEANIAARDALRDIPVESFVVESGTREEQREQHNRLLESAEAALDEAIEEALEEEGVIAPLASHTRFGACGSSSVSLRNGPSARRGIVGASVHVYDPKAGNAPIPGFAMTTNVLLFSTSHWNLWTNNISENVNLSGRSKWSNTTSWTFPQRLKQYGATLNEATVRLTHPRFSWCHCAGPSVNNVVIY